jgi:hypothetical protein
MAFIVASDPVTVSDTEPLMLIVSSTPTPSSVRAT